MLPFMKRMTRVLFVWFGLHCMQAGHAQDIVSANMQYCKLLYDTAGIKMILVTLPPKAKLQTHTHAMCICFVIQGGVYKWTYVNGATESLLMKDGDHFMDGPTDPHYSWNGGNTTIQFLLVEYLLDKNN